MKKLENEKMTQIEIIDTVVNCPRCHRNFAISDGYLFTFRGIEYFRCIHCGQKIALDIRQYSRATLLFGTITEKVRSRNV